MEGGEDKKVRPGERSSGGCTILGRVALLQLPNNFAKYQPLAKHCILGALMPSSSDYEEEVKMNSY